MLPVRLCARQLGQNRRQACPDLGFRVQFVCNSCAGRISIIDAELVITRPSLAPLRETEPLLSPVKAPQRRAGEKTSFATLIDLHIDDMREVGKSLPRSKRDSPKKLRRDLGDVALKNLTREQLIGFGKAGEGKAPGL